MRTKETLAENISDAIYDNITTGYGGSIEGYNITEEKCIEIAEEYSKEVAIEFQQFMEMYYQNIAGRYTRQLTKEELHKLDDWPDLDTLEYFTIEQLFNQFIQSIKQ